MFSLADKRALVTGGSSGIGAAIVERLRAAGAQVMVADRRPPESDGPFVRADVAEESDIVRMLDTTCTAFGGLDILVNNAGIQPLGVGFDTLTAELFDRTFAVNARGVALGVKHAARVLPTGGRIVNLASFVGVIGVPGGAAYAASKATVAHLTRLAALELAPRQITVNAISPGTIRTPAVTSIRDNPEIPFVERHTPLGRLGEPNEVAALCHFLVSHEAAYITGQNISIDGGITAGWMDYALEPPANIQNGRWIDDL